MRCRTLLCRSKSISINPQNGRVDCQQYVRVRNQAYRAAFTGNLGPVGLAGFLMQPADNAVLVVAIQVVLVAVDGANLLLAAQLGIPAELLQVIKLRRPVRAGAADRAGDRLAPCSLHPPV